MRLTVRDAAAVLSVSEKTIYRWISQGRLPAYRVGDQYRFNRSELLEWATAQRLNVSPEMFDEPDSAEAPLPRLSEALRGGGIFYRVEGADKPSVLKSIVSLMPVPDEVDREFLLRVMMARESLGSTGIGDGIAIPHVRNPIVLHVAKPTVTLVFLEQPVDFAAIDGKPVGTLFTVVSPTVRAHLHLLSRLSFALRDPAVRDALARQAPREEIYRAIEHVENALTSTAAEPGKDG
jgi:PTS system nitrogen regulatory IIA component